METIISHRYFYGSTIVCNAVEDETWKTQRGLKERRKYSRILSAERARREAIPRGAVPSAKAARLSAVRAEDNKKYTANFNPIDLSEFHLPDKLSQSQPSIEKGQITMMFKFFTGRPCGLDLRRREWGRWGASKRSQSERQTGGRNLGGPGPMVVFLQTKVKSEKKSMRRS